AAQTTRPRNRRNLSRRRFRGLARCPRATGREDGARRAEPGTVAGRLRARRRPVPPLPAGAGAGRAAGEAAQRPGQPGIGRTVRPRARRLIRVDAASMQARATTQWRLRIDAALEHILPAADEPPLRLHAAMRHAALLGGKRMRPLLVYATGTAFGASLEALDAPALAVELVHAYSLVHD